VADQARAPERAVCRMAETEVAHTGAEIEQHRVVSGRANGH
jgi:hypothetical protein